MSGRELIERLPPVRGRLTPSAPIGPMTWFRVGGPAEVLFRPVDEADLAEFLAATPQDIVARVYTDVAPKALAMAERPVLAHLEKLLDDGLVQKSSEGLFLPIA